MAKLKTTTKRIIEVNDWDNLIRETYKKPYSFQQQDGCQERGLFEFEVPANYNEESEMHDKIPEEVNGEKMGVKFDVWLARDPDQPLNDNSLVSSADWEIKLFWHRNFYPSIYTLIDDLHKKGLLNEGKYTINIDW